MDITYVWETDGVLREDSAIRFIANRYRKALMCPALCDKIKMCKLSHVLLENQTQQGDTIWRNVVISWLYSIGKVFTFHFVDWKQNTKQGIPLARHHQWTTEHWFLFSLKSLIILTSCFLSKGYHLTCALATWFSNVCEVSHVKALTSVNLDRNKVSPIIHHSSLSALPGCISSLFPSPE